MFLLPSMLGLLRGQALPAGYTYVYAVNGSTGLSEQVTAINPTTGNAEPIIVRVS